MYGFKNHKTRCPTSAQETNTTNKHTHIHRSQGRVGSPTPTSTVVGGNACPLPCRTPNPTSLGSDGVQCRPLPYVSAWGVVVVQFSTSGSASTPQPPPPMVQTYAWVHVGNNANLRKNTHTHHHTSNSSTVGSSVSERRQTRSELAEGISACVVTRGS